MVDLGVELNAPRRLALNTERRYAHILRPGNQPIRRGHRSDRIAVRHPHLRPGRQSRHQRVGGIAHRQHRPAIFAAGCGLHLAAEGRSQVLRPVADAQERQTALYLPEVGSRRVLVAHGIGAARKDDTPHRRVERRNLVERMDFAIDVQLAHAPRDKLRILRTEVEDKDFFHL